MALSRLTQLLDVTIANGAALSNELPMDTYAGGIIYMPAAWTAASIGFKVAHTGGGTYYPLYDHDGTLVQVATPTANNAYELPPEVYGALHIKLWSQDGAGADTNQGAARAFHITLKS